MSYFESILNTYKHHNWEYTANEETNVAFMLVETPVGEFTMVASADESSGLIQLFARLPLECAEASRSAISQVLGQLNFLLNLGAWVLDDSDGEIRFRLSQIYLTPPSTEQVEQQLRYVFAGHDSFAAPLLSYLSEQITLEALQEEINTLFLPTEA
jgi:hypothetical protein